MKRPVIDNTAECAAEALEQSRALQLTYDGQSRLVEVHAIGITHDGEAIMLVWQVRGGSRSGRACGWKYLLLREVTQAYLSEVPAGAPRPGYNGGGAGMHRVFRQLPARRRQRPPPGGASAFSSSAKR